MVSQPDPKHLCSSHALPQPPGQAERQNLHHVWCICTFLCHAHNVSLLSVHFLLESMQSDISCTYLIFLTPRFYFWGLERINTFKEDVRKCARALVILTQSRGSWEGSIHEGCHFQGGLGEIALTGFTEVRRHILNVSGRSQWPLFFFITLGK